MSGWTDLVTTALLGTDRRPVPTELDLGWGAVDLSRLPTDPTAAVLGLAATYRSLIHAGVRLGRAPSTLVGTSAPAGRLPLAPAAAQDLLAGLLAKPDPGLVNSWLSSCASRGLGAPPELWPRLAALAARSTAYDRVLLVRTLGPRGRWFLRQNPVWSRLAEVTDAESERPGPAGSTPQPPEPATRTPADEEEALAYAELGESPMRAWEMILACPDPLSRPLVLAALRLVSAGALGAETRQAAVRLSHRIPLHGWSELSESAEPSGTRQSMAPVVARTVQLSLDLIQQTVRARMEIDDVFATATEGETSP